MVRIIISLFVLCLVATQAFANLPSSPIAFVSRGENLYIVNPQTGKSRKIMSGVGSIVFSPDRKKIAAVEGLSQFTDIITLDGKKLARLMNCTVTDWSVNDKLVGLAPTADEKGTRLFVSDSNGRNRKYLKTLSPDTISCNFRSPKWSPNGKKIAFIKIFVLDNSNNSAFFIWENGQSKKIYTIEDTISDVYWVDDRYLIANTVGAIRSTSQLLVLDTKTAQNTIDSSVKGYYNFGELCVSRATKEIVVKGDWGYYDTTLYKIFLMRINGLELTIDTEFTQQYDEMADLGISSPVWSSDGRYIAYQGIHFQKQKDDFSKIVSQIIIIIDTKEKKLITKIKIPEPAYMIYW